MPFQLKKGLHHSPDWYESHCHGEDGGSPVWRAMFKLDLARIGADFDEAVTYQENIGNYREQWNQMEKTGGRIRGQSVGPDIVAEMVQVVEAELGKGFFAAQEYESEPFLTIGCLMDQHDLSENSVREFLKWRARQGAVKKRKAQKPKTPKPNAVQELIRRKLFKSRGAD